MAFGDDPKAIRFQERVRIRLAALNRTQSDVARDLKMSPQALSNVIGRFPDVNYRSLEKLASELGVTVSWLIEGDPKEAIASHHDVLPELGGI